jgi:hypothetical protein
MSAPPSDLQVTAEDVREEHLDEVDGRTHLLYLAGVLVGAFLLMIALMVVLDSLT